VNIVTLNNGTEGLEFEDIAFCNTHLFTETARHYKKNGVYTLAPEGTRDFEDFWDQEQDRLINGMSAPGKLITNARGETQIQNIHITGDHYGYLNYGQIKLTDELKGRNALESVIKDATHTMVARKVVDFPSFWDGDYHFYKAKEFAENKGKNLYVMKARRKGYSYKNAFAAAHKALMVRRSTTIIGAYDNKYLLKGDGTMTMARNYVDFIFENTEFNRGFLSDAKDHLIFGYKEEGSKIRKGYKSQILALSFADNPDAAIGKDAELIIIDEAGKFPNLKEMYAVTQPTLEDGKIIIGILIVFGTGGTKDANWAAFEHMYYNPQLYNGLIFNNVWDEGGRGNGVGFFHKYTLNLKPYIDKDGNSMEKESFDAMMQEREDIKKIATSAQDINMHIGQRCICPSEGFSRTQDNLFSSKELDDHIRLVANDDTIKNFSRKGSLKYSDSAIKFVYNESLDPMHRHDPIVNFPHKATDDVHGCFVEWYSPYRDIHGLIPSNMYRVWVDPYAHDKDKEEIRLRDSLGSIIVYERVNPYTQDGGDKIVAMFVGRPPEKDTFNEMVLKVTRYYNAKCHPETDRGDVVAYFKRMGFYHLLADEPEAFYNKDPFRKGTRKKGTRIGDDPERKGMAAIMLKEWLYKVRETDEGGNPTFNFQYIYDLPLLMELQKWNLKGNFDRVSSLLVGMYDKEDVFNAEIQAATQTTTDDFFNRGFFS
jgi:hypothetical protein